MSKFLYRKDVICFGEFEANLRLRQLRKRGQPVPLQEKPFEILEMLLAKPGEVVSRDKLRSRLWPETNYGELDHGLDVCVEKLRHALGDPVANSRYIKTIRGRGYSLIAPVEMKKLGRSKQQTGKMRLAVLPSAVDGSNKPCGESNFCDKLAVEIGASLAYLYSDQIGVIAHNVVSRYRGTTKSITQIGRELRADYLLDVSCWTAAAHSCIMVQLIHAKDETVLWAKGYDYAPGNPVPIQKDIGERVAQSVGLRLLPQRSTIRLEQESPRGDVLLLYQKGCYHQWEQSEESLRKSIECFERAVRLDPAYASAYAALANSYSIVGLFGFAGPPREWFPKALKAARAALSINDTIATPYVSLAIVKYLYERDWKESETLLRRALELNPSDSLAHRLLAYLLASKGRPEHAIAEARRACELDPTSLSSSVCLAAAYYLGRRYEEAITTLQAILDVRPTFGPALMWLGASYTTLLRHADAISALEKARKYRFHPLVEAWLGSAYARAGLKRKAEEIVAKLARLSVKNYVSPFCFAFIYAGLRQIDQTFEWLAKAGQEYCPFCAALVPVDPRLDFLRSDSRYTAFANRFLAA